MRDQETEKPIAYIEKVFAPEDEHLTELRKEIESCGKGGIQIRAYEGRLLQTLCAAISAKKVVEIGMLMGYSTTWLARALPEEGELHSLEKNPEMIKKAKEFFAKAGLEQKIRVYEGEAEESLRKLSDQGPFDLIFIDANKSGYFDYLLWAEKHLRPGGMIIGDNTLLFGHVYQDEKPLEVSKSQWQAMRQFNQHLADSKDFTSILIPTAEGLTVAVKSS